MRVKLVKLHYYPSLKLPIFNFSICLVNNAYNFTFYSLIKWLNSDVKYFLRNEFVVKCSLCVCKFVNLSLKLTYGASDLDLTSWPRYWIHKILWEETFARFKLWKGPVRAQANFFFAFSVHQHGTNPIVWDKCFTKVHPWRQIVFIMGDTSHMSVVEVIAHFLMITVTISIRDSISVRKVSIVAASSLLSETEEYDWTFLGYADHN